MRQIRINIKEGKPEGYWGGTRKLRHPLHIILNKLKVGECFDVPQFMLDMSSKKNLRGIARYNETHHGLDRAFTSRSSKFSDTMTFFRTK